jgi:23S rRNA pseudouridine1911/1915/1917 synthase
VAFNKGYSYREQLGARARGQSTLSYLAAYWHSPLSMWRKRLAGSEVLLDDLPRRARSF